MWICPTCRTELNDSALSCPRCKGQSPSPGVAPNRQSGSGYGYAPGTAPMPAPALARGNPMLYRYSDLYKSARLAISIGNAVKIIGLVIGAIIVTLFVFSGINLGSGLSTAPMAFAGMIGGVITAAIPGGGIFLLGILISGQGQLLLAQADAAIFICPFMTNEEKAQAMSLHHN
jgi:hypothetical protein